ncbi:hypothetical protein [Pectobacterium sp. CHL-2024]|uniref:hypothetical protein n=1 Tax=Pectobacterium sp. CHL-2024 TaxID=3377079 RepID=UPI0037FB5162
MTGIIISTSDFQTFSPATQQEILAVVTGKGNFVRQSDRDEPLLDLSSSQAASLVRGLSEKSRNVLISTLELLEKDPSGAWLEDIAYNMKVEISDIRGVWSGITRRTRKVTNDSSAELFYWSFDAEKEDSKAELHETTIQNLRKALNL